jgi:hypothetical protein
MIGQKNGPVYRKFEGTEVHRAEYRNKRAHLNPPKRFAPYAHQLTPSQRSIAVLTGSGAWERAESRTWLDGRKLVLPLGDDPASYRWPVAGRDCILYSFGTQEEPRERLENLSIELIDAGALFVVWNVPGDIPTTCYEGFA